MTMDFSAFDIIMFFNNSHPTVIESAEKLMLRAALDGKHSTTMPIVSSDEWLIPEIVRELENKGFRTVLGENDEGWAIIIKW